MKIIPSMYMLDYLKIGASSRLARYRSIVHRQSHGNTIAPQARMTGSGG